MMSKMSGVASNAFLVLVLLLAACGPAATPTPRPAPPPSPTSAPAAPAPSPTSAPLPIRPTPTVAPATPTPAAAKPSEEKPRYGGILKAVNSLDIAHYDAHQTITTKIVHAVVPIYSLLVQNDPRDEAKIIGDLAERWEISPDGRTYTFYLHKGAKFHDGVEATSADVKATFEHIALPPKGVSSPRQALFPALDRIETPDKYTVKFLLKQPQASLLTVIAAPWNTIYPKRLLDQDPNEMKRKLVGTGPFKFKSYTRGVIYEIEKNPDYFVPGRPYLDRITFYIILDAASQRAAIRTGQVHMLGAGQHEMIRDEREILKKEMPDLQIWVVPATGHYAAAFNATKKPFSDVRLRRAASLAFDRRAAIEVLTRGDCALGTVFIPGTEWALSPEEVDETPGWRKDKEKDRAEAKKLLAEAGYPEGFDTSILVRQGGRWERYAVFTAAELKKIGINAKLDVTEEARRQVKMANKDFDMLIVGDTAAIADPDGILGAFYLTTSGQNWGGYSNPKIDEMFVKQSATLDPVERKKVVREMEKTILNDTPRIIMWAMRGESLAAFALANVRGFNAHKNIFSNYKHQDVWLAQ